MRVSQEWLSEFVDLDDLGPGRIDELLTMSGTEVERVGPFAIGLDQVVVAQVAEVARMEGSDHLWLAKVRIPDHEPEDVVCGAPNLTKGALIAWARPGTVLPQGMKLGQRRIRGTVSNGMICALDELGLGSEHEGVLLLPADEVEPGEPLSQVFPPDTVYDLEILSNRADCLSHWGVARELAAVLDRPLRDPELTEPERSGPPAQESVSVGIEAAGECPIYSAECIDELGEGPTPLWMLRRLLAVGARPISPVVDLANYVMLEIGQPVHTFDLDRMRGAPDAVAIGVRRGLRGESLDCLDGVVRQLDPECLVITAGDQPVALAGVIGGTQTAVEPGTRRIALEVANFNWVSIRKTSRRLGLRTEASSRFERHLSPALVAVGRQRFLHLISRVAGGKVRPGPVIAGGLPEPSGPIHVSSNRTSRLLGLEVTAADAAAALRRLQFQVQVSGDELTVIPVAERTDISLPEDITEEVGRILGYHRVTATLPALRTPPSGNPGLTRAQRLAGEVCIGAGFTEAVTSSLVSQEPVPAVQGMGLGFAAIQITNPLSSQLGSLRVSCLPGLLGACRLNQSRGGERTALFELGRVFWRTGNRSERPEEPEVLALVDHRWGAAARPAAERVDHLLQVVEALAERVSLDGVEFRPAERSGFSPGRCAEAWVRGELRGVLGELDLALARELELRGTAVGAELRVDGWLVDGGRPGRGMALAKTPQLALDLAVTVPEQAALGPAMAAVGAAAISELEDIRLVDRYWGTQLPEGAKGWTFRLAFRDPQRTLTHREGEKLRSRVLAALETAVGAQVRAGAM
ncbi:MAG: phenylalanine--tRNA ligase subunit beta [Candidatus Dormiibacterota bacterium]